MAMPNASERVAASKKLRKQPPKGRVTPRIKQREVDRAEATIDLATERIARGGRDRIEVDEETGIATAYRVVSKSGDKSQQEAALEAVEHFENLGWSDVSVQAPLTKESGRFFHFTLSGNTPDIEDEVIPMRDHDGTIIYLKVENRYESAVGPAVRGYAYSEPAVLNKQYLGSRALPLTMVYDKAKEDEVRRAARGTARASRRTGGGHCHHCGEPTKGGRFVPGHDAKLKGDLIREATTEAEAERIIRRWTSEPEKMAPVLAKLVARDQEFIEERVIERTGLTREELF
jgi:hypothetical protein